MVVRWGYIVAAKIKLSSNCVKPTGTWVPDCEFVIFPYKVRKMRKYQTYVIHIPYIYLNCEKKILYMEDHRRFNLYTA